MKTWLVLGSALMLARPAAGQVAPPIAPPAAGPLEEVQRGELRIGLSAVSALRSSVLTGTGFANTTTTLSGVEVFGRTQGLGLYARSLSGTFAASTQGLAGDFVLQEARLVLGGATLSVEAGAIKRTTSTLNDQRDETFWRGGFRSFWDIGSSGVQVTLSAGARFGNVPDGSSKSLKFVGADGEATVIVQAPRNLPIYALAGWRYERFDDLWSVTARTEEMTGPMFGLGFRLASRPVLR